ncbi:flavodoxin family protein [Jeotgalibacillus soli]|uniref:NAD(P)H-dependent oxidoreductase n=1 Tax=Jeotgalibacillus soli TaxID=889306 RepID=A0A0C2R8Y5_9BACL|nr:NAD(P)H-dependent oxidoreductase [Jeotgalibacillus soli]KIL46760.1 NAD(P)H-dependent oxidoreductase [Jeotgalibacillus soli]
MSLLIICGSSRNDGNTETLAKAAASFYPGDVEWMHLRNHRIHQIVDQRHEPRGFDPVDDDHRALIEQMLRADAVIFATPVYWYGMSGHMKTFIDRWSQRLREPDLKFKERLKNKPAYVIICGGEQVMLKGLPLILQFRLIFEFVDMDFKNYFIGQAKRPGDILKDTEQLSKLKDFFNRK